MSDPVGIDFAARRRFSVSRLNGELEIVEETATTPAAFGDEQPTVVAPEDLGTLAHEVLARLDFRRPDTLEEVVHQVVARGGPAVELGSLVQQMISTFLDSKRTREIASARQIHRELEFLFAWPPPSGAGNAQRMGRYLQGVIDCLYQDHDGRWHVIDYKTNRVSAESLSTVARKYQMQMSVYALAVEKILREPPMELTLHFLRTGGEYSFAWDDAARIWTIETVNQAIEKSLQSV